MIASAPGQRTQISGRDAFVYLHELRSIYDAIAVGIGTVLADNPMLTARISGHEHSIVRIVFDSKLQIPLDSKLVQSAADDPLWVIHKGAPEKTRTQLEEKGVRLIESGACVSSALNTLADAGITRLLVEGGAKLHHSFIDAELYDEVQILRSVHALPDDGLKAAEFDERQLIEVEKRNLGKDLLEIYRKK